MLRLRRLRMRVRTRAGTFGTDLSFHDGLNILRADNTSGKSTCLQAIVYALGLEGMLSARREIPLAHAMTDELEVDGSNYRVDESWVQLEVQNGAGTVMTVRRAVTSATADTHLMQVEYRDELDGPVTSAQDFFVRRPGAAQRDAGFHTALARFLGWELPRVTRNDGSESPLYLECIFPHFYVEQKHGWSGLQSRIPTYYQIRDVAKRSAEFVLGLEVYERILARQRLESAGQIIISEWREATEILASTTRSSAVVVQGLPPRPVSDPDELVARTFVSQGEAWTPLDDELTRLRSVLAERQSAPVRRVDEETEQAEAALPEAQRKLLATSALLRESIADSEEMLRRTETLEARIEALEAEITRQLDVQVLAGLGGTNLPVADGYQVCPTCDQRLLDGFEITTNPMTPEENISYLRREVQTYRGMRDDLSRAQVARQAQIDALQVDAADLRRQIRALQDVLTSASETPSAEQITERIRLEERVERLGDCQLKVTESLETLRGLSQQWARNRALLEGYASSALTGADRQVLDRLQSSFIEQLQGYGFRSLDPDSLEISADSYRPVHEGFDLGFDLSASDMVRVIWAYLIGILETAQNTRAHHLGLLIFDEPRQQEASLESFQALLTRAGNNAQKGAQILLATSAELSTLDVMLKDIGHHMISFPPGAKIIQAVD